MKKKKLLTAVLALVMAFGVGMLLSACGSDDYKDTQYEQNWDQSNNNQDSDHDNNETNNEPNHESTDDNAQKYLITFDYNDDSNEKVEKEYVAGDVIQVLTVVKYGYTVENWCTTADGTGETYSDTYTMPNYAVTLYAQWTAVINTITFEVNAPTGNPSTPEPIIAGTDVDISKQKPNDPKVNGQRFLGWYTVNDTLFTFETMPAQDLTLYGKWEEAEIIGKWRCTASYGGKSYYDDLTHTGYVWTITFDRDGSFNYNMSRYAYGIENLSSSASGTYTVDANDPTHIIINYLEGAVGRTDYYYDQDNDYITNDPLDNLDDNSEIYRYAIFF